MATNSATPEQETAGKIQAADRTAEAMARPTTKHEG
jgi:hypothetical protein